MRVVLAGETATAVQQFRPQVNGLGLQCDGTDCVSFDNLRLRLSAGAPADLVIVVAGEDQLAALNAVQHGAPRGPVLAVTGSEDADFEEQLSKAGVRGLLGADNFRTQLQETIEQLERQGAIRVRRGRVIVVTSAQGGSGVTTTASALAFALAEPHPNEVLLAELVVAVPELALDLDLKPKYSLGDLIDNWGRADLSMVRQVAVQHTVGGVQVLAYAPETLAGRVLTAEQTRHLVVLLRESAGHVVLDVGHSVNPASLEAMRLAESVVVVVRPDVPAVRLARAYLLQLRDQGIPLARLRPLINRGGYRGQVERSEVQRVLGLAPSEWVDDDPSTVIGALAKGQPLVEYYPRARITRSFGRLAKLLDGVTT